MENNNVENERRERERETTLPILELVEAAVSIASSSLVFLESTTPFLSDTEMQPKSKHPRSMDAFLAGPFLRFRFQIKQRKKLISDTDKKMMEL